MLRIAPEVVQALMHAMAIGARGRSIPLVDSCRCGATRYAYALFDRAEITDGVRLRTFRVEVRCINDHAEETDGRFTLRG